jgi:hypothetical protein
MKIYEQQRLQRVEEHMDQLISATAEWLTISAQTPEQLVLSVARIRELRVLQGTLRKQVKSPWLQSEQAWIIVKVLISTILGYILQLLSDSIKYLLRRECWYKLHYTTNAHGKPLESDYEYGKNNKIFKNGKRSKTIGFGRKVRSNNKLSFS